MTRKYRLAAGAALLYLLGGNARADYTLTVNQGDDRGTWEGWGCSLSWWGNGVGSSAYQDTSADLIFTFNTVPLYGLQLPARYLASVALYMQSDWGTGVAALEPFSEPSAGWWTYPKDQEGCNLTRDVQKEVLGYPRRVKLDLLDRPPGCCPVVSSK